jgi:predicted AAA+ superfamily ATPase
MIKRPQLMASLKAALKRSRCVGLSGPRQCGKSTLARQLAGAGGESSYFDLEDPTALARLSDPKLALAPLRGLVVIDEVQRMPELFPLLRVLLDREPLPARFLLLGSAAPELLRGASESLAGRMEFLEMGGFRLSEVGDDHQRSLWTRGGFPLSWLAGDDADSFRWRSAFLQAFVERDLRLLGVDLPPMTVRRFLTMLAHYHGQTWNASEVGRSLGLAHTTVNRYLDLLAGALLLRVLPPWYENLGKRLIKSPKVYIKDSGLLHQLLGLRTFEDLEGHPKMGASWEGFALEQTLATFQEEEAFYWATHAGAELDLLLMRGRHRVGMEFKYSSAPTTTKSMHIALEDLKLEHLWVVYPGTLRYPLTEKITALPLRDIGTIKLGAG